MYSEDSRKSGFKEFAPAEKEDRHKTMMGFTGEKDYEIAPCTGNHLHWTYFVSDLYSTDR